MAYPLVFHVPVDLWQDTRLVESQATRTFKRAKVKRMCAPVWRDYKLHVGKTRVIRYILFVGVSAPRNQPYTAVLADYTAKPIIDVGSPKGKTNPMGVGAYPDDDSQHRYLTVYFEDGTRNDTDDYRVTLVIQPIGIAWLAQTAYRDAYGSALAEPKFHVPWKHLLSSNYTDLDLIAHWHGKESKVKDSHKSEKGLGARQLMTAVDVDEARKIWETMPKLEERIHVLVEVAYPSRNEHDPDNLAEQVEAILTAGILSGRIESKESIASVGFIARERPTYGGYDFTLHCYPANGTVAGILTA